MWCHYGLRGTEQSRLGKGICHRNVLWKVACFGRRWEYSTLRAASYRLHVLAVIRTNSHKNRQPSGGPGFNSLRADRLVYLAELERGKEI